MIQPLGMESNEELRRIRFASRLGELNLNGTANDLTLDFGYDPAGRIASNTRSNDAYAWGGHYAVNRNYTTNGLNQYTASGSATLTYDGRGNLASDGTHSFTHTAENRLAQMGSSVLLSHDAAGWLSQVVGSVNTLFDAPGGTIVSERDGYYALLRRYVHGAGGEPLVWYEGTGTSARHWLHADERGSVIALSNDAGNLTNVNTYDEHGIPGAANAGRFQYTGQAWLGDLGMYYYRNRIYSPTLGRFLQTDPIGFGGGMNIYAYVFNNPVNRTDPSGLCTLMGHFVSVWEHGGYGPWTLQDSWWTGSDCGFDYINWGPAGDSPLDGNNTGDGPHDSAGNPNQEHEECSRQPFSGILGDSRVQSQIRTMMDQAIHTNNLGLGADIPSHGSEFGFMASIIPIPGTPLPYIYVGGLSTDYREHQVGVSTNIPSFLTFDQFWLHAHQSPTAGPGLSIGDVSIHYNVIAVSRDGTTYCATRRGG
jgi:RHS repeat-associated protein